MISILVALATAALLGVAYDAALDGRYAVTGLALIAVMAVLWAARPRADSKPHEVGATPRALYQFGALCVSVGVTAITIAALGFGSSATAHVVLGFAGLALAGYGSFKVFSARTWVRMTALLGDREPLRAVADCRVLTSTGLRLPSHLVVAATDRRLVGARPRWRSDHLDLTLPYRDLSGVTCEAENIIKVQTRKGDMTLQALPSHIAALITALPRRQTPVA